MVLLAAITVYYFFIINSVNSLQMCTSPDQLKSAVIGEKLEGFLIETITRTSLMVCSRECFYQTNCLSFNFNTQTGQCELNRNITSTAFPLISSPAFIYANKSDWVNLVTDSCRLVTCLENEKCVLEGDNGVCELYDCSPPPDMDYSSQPKFLGTVTGYDAVYSCFGPGVVKEDVTLTCKNGSWVGDKCRKISSCFQIKQCNRNYTDGEYWIYPLQYGNNQRVKMYCHDLNTTSPTEYVTLPKGNVASHSNLISTFVNSCQLKISDRTDWGKSIFKKVRVNPDTMVVDVDDFEFAELVDGVHQRYGIAMDCARLIMSCVDVTGYFMINTTNTGLIVDQTLTWTTFGWTPILTYVNRTSPYILEANCGGHCGGCKSDGPLNFVLDPDIVLDDNLAIEVLC